MSLFSELIGQVTGRKSNSSRGSEDSSGSQGSVLVVTNDMINEVSNRTVGGLSADRDYSTETKEDMVREALRGARNGTDTNSGKIEKALRKLKTPGGNRLISDGTIDKIIARFSN